VTVVIVRMASLSGAKGAGTSRLNGTINPGNVFHLVLPLARVAKGYRAMDERRAIKTRLRP
jgi:threonine dehydrogenase-like Zn-dependent dehydrogenase